MLKLLVGPRLWIGLFVSSFLAFHTFISFAHATDAVKIERVSSPYSEKLASLPFNQLEPFDTNDFSLTCLSTEGSPFLIGTSHQIKLNASFGKVVEVFEDFSKYAEIFVGLEKVELTSRPDPKSMLVKYESSIPFPFIPNTHYSVIYDVKESTPEHKIYTYQLLKSEDLNSLDGMIYIKKVSPEVTLYYELDFLNAKWGVAEKLAPKSIWRESVAEVVQSDYAVKFRAEDFKKPLSRVKHLAELEASDRTMEKRIEECIKNKKNGNEIFKWLTSTVKKNENRK